jgi:hypothetical protein
MATDKHSDIRAWLQQAATGPMPSNRSMRLNPKSGKWELCSAGERPGDQVAQVDAEDMKAFA